MKEKHREQIIAGIRKGRDEIRQIFTDCAHWNDNVRKPNEEKIDCDPDGEMARIEKCNTAILDLEDTRKIGA